MTPLHSGMVSVTDGAIPSCLVRLHHAQVCFQNPGVCDVGIIGAIVQRHLKMLDRLAMFILLVQCQGQIIMCLRQLGVGRDGLLEMFLCNIPMALLIMFDPFIVGFGTVNICGSHQCWRLRIHGH